MDCGETAAANVVWFWFDQIEPRQWFVKDQGFDAQLRHRLIGLTRAAIGGELNHWPLTPEQGLALVLLLDQLPRQIWLEWAMAFAGDAQALALRKKAQESC